MGIHCEVPAIRSWLHDFMIQLNRSRYTLNGQLCFDFIVVHEEGTAVAYPIECNPRVHSQCSIYNRDDVRSVFGSLLLAHTPAKEAELTELLERDYMQDGETSLNIYWFYNEFFKIFPNGWLLHIILAMIIPSAEHCYSPKQLFAASLWRQIHTTWIYIPSACTHSVCFFFIVIASPVLLICGACHIWSWYSSAHGSIRIRKSSAPPLTPSEHVSAMFIKADMFLQRLENTRDNVDTDLWSSDPVPFLAKNHLQVPSRLLASLVTGVEWKKVDFCIGKVVEVGGD